MGETVGVRLQECMPTLCQRIWRFGQISCRKPDKMVQETTSTQPGRCLGMLCGTNSVLCVKKTVPHYLADPGVLSVKRQYLFFNPYVCTACIIGTMRLHTSATNVSNSV